MCRGPGFAGDDEPDQVVSLPQFDRIAEVERLPVLEHGAKAPPKRLRQTSSTGAQYAALLTWPRRSTSVERSCQVDFAAPSSGGGRSSRVEARRPAAEGP